jgi:hypothetical protein
MQRRPEGRRVRKINISILQACSALSNVGPGNVGNLPEPAVDLTTLH